MVCFYFWTKICMTSHAENTKSVLELFPHSREQDTRLKVVVKAMEHLLVLQLCELHTGLVTVVRYSCVGHHETLTNIVLRLGPQIS